MYATRLDYWKELFKCLAFILCEWAAGAIPFSAWPILFWLIHKEQNRPQDSDHVAGGNNNLIPEESNEKPDRYQPV